VEYVNLKKYYTWHQNLKLDLYHLLRNIVADPHHFDANPDPTFPFDEDACPNPTFHTDADPDPAPHQGNAKLRPLPYKPSLNLKPPRLQSDYPTATNGFMLSL
jgi:hypothetical protein